MASGRKKTTPHEGGAGAFRRNREMEPGLDPGSDKVEHLLPHTLTLNVQPERAKMHISQVNEPGVHPTTLRVRT